MRPRITAVWLAISAFLLLIITNLYWLHIGIDAGITEMYRDQQLGETSEALRQAQMLIPAVDPSLNRTEIIQTAERITGSESFEKDGCVWIGYLGFQFDENERLLHVNRAWNFGEPDPCFP